MVTNLTRIVYMDSPKALNKIFTLPSFFLACCKVKTLHTFRVGNNIFNPM